MTAERDTKPFPWGRVVASHHIGEYEFIEYHPRKIRSAGLVSREVDLTVTVFHDETNHRSSTTLDRALLEAICCKYDGPNQQLARYIAGALGMGREKEETP